MGSLRTRLLLGSWAPSRAILLSCVRGLGYLAVPGWGGTRVGGDGSPAPCGISTPPFLACKDNLGLSATSCTSVSIVRVVLLPRSRRADVEKSKDVRKQSDSHPCRGKHSHKAFAFWPPDNGIDAAAPEHLAPWLHYTAEFLGLVPVRDTDWAKTTSEEAAAGWGESPRPAETPCRQARAISRLNGVARLASGAVVGMVKTAALIFESVSVDS